MSAATRRLSDNAYGREYGAITDEFGTIPQATEQQIHAAQMQVALHGGPDVAEILAMLGLGKR